MNALAALTIAIAACACATVEAPPQPAPAAPAERIGEPFPNIPTHVSARGVAVEAVLYVETERAFGVDLIKQSRVLPIGVRLGREDGDAGRARFLRSEANLRLYLPDGTVLVPAPRDSIHVPSRRAQNRVQALELSRGPLTDWASAPERFVYFQLPPPREMHVGGARVVRRLGPLAREMQLAHACLAIELEVDGTFVPLLVALQVLQSPERP